MKKELKEMYQKRLKIKFMFKRKTLKLFLKQIEYFCEAEDNYKLPQTRYKIGDEVLLKKGTFLHGTRKTIEGLDLIKEHGFLSSDMYKEETKGQKTPWCTSMWNIQEDILLKDYINFYSGATIEYAYNDHIEEPKVIPYNKINEELENMRNSGYWKWRAEQTKEIRFMPSLAKDENQIGFIINTHNQYAKKIIENDIFKLSFNKKILASFISKWFIKEFIYTKRTAFTTNRESAIIVGMPSCLVEGILVGRRLEKDKKSLVYIKEKFPERYICNLDGKVIF